MKTGEGRVIPLPGGRRELLDLLWPSVLEDLELLPSEVRHEVAAAIEHRDREGHQVHAAAEDGLRAAGGSGHSQRGEQAQDCACHPADPTTAARERLQTSAPWCHAGSAAG